jgi:X-Pro dipeptidyl-peptidase
MMERVAREGEEESARMERIRDVLGRFALAGALAAGARAQEPGKTLPVFADGQAQVVPGFNDPEQWIRQELWVEAEFDSDGDGKRDRMHVDVTRPRQTDTEGLKVPVVYESSPYFSGTASTDSKYFWDPRQELGGKPRPRTPAPAIPFQPRSPRISDVHVGDWVPRGFAVVHSESPGTGLSQGCPTVGGPNEALAPKAVVDWLNSRAKGFSAPKGGERVEAGWSTGKVGMTGTSYDGTLALAAATTGVEGLEAIVPIAPNTSYYRYYRSNGLVRHPGGWMGEDMDVLFDFISSGDPARREGCGGRVRDDDLLKHIDRVTGDYNEFWAARDYWNQLEKVRAATILAHGLNDWNVMPVHSVKVYQALKARGVPAKLFLHQGGHGGGPPFELVNRWFTRFLCGIENGVEQNPRCFVVREGAERSRPAAYPDYPNPEAAVVTLHPGRGGGGVGPLTAAAPVESEKESLLDDVSERGAELAKAEKSRHRLLYATEPLAAPLHVSGTPRVKLRLAASKPAANLSVWLVSLPWTGGRDVNADLVNRGWADPQNHASLTKGEPLVPGRFYDLSFELEPDDQVLPAGERLGLMIFSSDRDFTLWPDPGTRLTVDLSATALELPVVGGAAAFEKATAAGR